MHYLLKGMDAPGQDSAVMGAEQIQRRQLQSINTLVLLKQSEEESKGLPL